MGPRALSSRRARLVVALGLVLVLVGALTRAAVTLRSGGLTTPASVLSVFAYGSALDLLVALVVLTPPAAFLAFRPSGPERPRLRFALVALFASAAVFAAFVEFCFFEEFDARFNHVALDYLLFPGEVAGNVWESYPVPLYVAAAALLGVGIALCVERFVRAVPPTGEARSEARLRARLKPTAGVLGLGGCGLLALTLIPARDTGDRERDEIASNGIVQLVRAFRTASLDYEAYYRTLPPRELATRARAEVGLPDLDAPNKTFRAVERRAAPLDVVVVLGESFGSEFVGRLGGRHPCAPGFERWAGEGLLLENLIATGNRTVRGLEGVLCSFVPLPGDSVWKRDKSDDVASIARVLSQQGYRSEFVYGGDGAFDGMRSFALRNGWSAFHEDALVGASSYPDEAFRTAWGVADEHIFAKLLERQQAAAREGVRFFGTALTVSNHKPFLTPDTQSTALRGEKLVRAGWQGAILLALSVLAWRYLARDGRRARIASLLALVWVGFLSWSWIQAQPRDSRESAVRYADRALAEYLDRARELGLLEHTVVLFVGDHGARVYGSEEIPAASYRIPALFLAPDARYRGATIPRLCSQVDLAPTLLSLAGIDYQAPFFGSDLLALPPDGPGRAWLIHNRNIGLLTDDQLIVLGLRGTSAHYRRASRDSDTFERAAAVARADEDVARTAAVFQAASLLYERGRYRLPHEP
ncbi:MAG: LTA synthase family protein [Planctomycetes bacterium]|nr:LTA synthase family protein [Planctomycetota bacterium]